MIALTDHQTAFVQGLLVFILANVGASIGQVPLVVNGSLNVAYLLLTLLPAIGTAILTYTRAHPQEADAALQDTLDEINAYLAALHQQQQQTLKSPLVVVQVPQGNTAPISNDLSSGSPQGAQQPMMVQVQPNPLADVQTAVDTQSMRALRDG